MKKIIDTRDGVILNLVPLFAFVVFLMFCLPTFFGYFDLPITVVNASKVALGFLCLICIIKDMSFKEPVFYWFLFLLLNTVYFFLFQSVDETAKGKFFSILLVNIMFYPLYFAGRYQWLEDEFFIKLFYILLSITIFIHFHSMSNKRIDRMADDVVVNTSYIFTYLFPFVFLIKSKLRALFITFLMFAMVVLGAKRGALITFVAGAFFWFIYAFLYLEGTRKNILNRFIISQASIVISLGGVIFLLSKFSFAKQRLLTLLEGEGGSGRSLMYQNVWNGWLNADNLINTFFGFGFSASRSFTGNNLYAHSDWLETLINFGVLGVVLYSVFWLLCFKKVFVKSINRRMKFQLLSILSICLLASVFSMVYSAAGSASIAICLLAYLLGRIKSET